MLEAIFKGKSMSAFWEGKYNSLKQQAIGLLRPAKPPLCEHFSES